MIYKLLCAIGLTGISLGLLATVWVATHLRDLPEVNDADLRTIHKVAGDVDAAPDLYRAESLLHIEKGKEESLWDWAKGKRWDESGVTDLLSENAAALEALTAADGKPGLAIPPERVWRVPSVQSANEPVIQDTTAWRNLTCLRVLRALRLQRQGRAQAALAELLATARLGYVIEGAANGSLMHYMSGAAIKARALSRLIEVAASSELSREAFLALAAGVATLDANERGFADAWAGEYRVQLGFLEEISASMRAHAGPKSLLPFLIKRHFARALGTLLPVEYLYQPHRSAALWADFYRPLRRSAGQTYLAYTREATHENKLELLLRLVAGPNAVGLAYWHIGIPSREGFVARKCGENVRAAATSAILSLLAYEHEHGSLPDRLDELLPGELSQVPIDNFDGAPLRYSRERRRLWSVGTELRDDGGSDDGVTPDMKQPTFPIPRLGTVS